MVPTDDVDAESLQAQVDMTMSFAHNLVTSWINPCHFAQRGASAPQMPEDEFRRPPRLGVGTSIPAMAPLTHEAAKLKHKFGKSKAKNGGVKEPGPRCPPDSDDEERKGRPIRRKANMDPFGREDRKKKRKTHSEADPHLPVQDAPKCTVQCITESTEHDKDTELANQRPTDPLFSEPSRETSVPAPGRKISLESNRDCNGSVTDEANLKPFGIPFLTLNEPPEANESSGNTELNGWRRRKRRKKKKKTISAGGGPH